MGAFGSFSAPAGVGKLSFCVEIVGTGCACTIQFGAVAPVPWLPWTAISTRGLAGCVTAQRSNTGTTYNRCSSALTRPFTAAR